MKVIILSILCLCSFTAFAQIKLVQPDFKPNGKVVNLNIDNKFEVEGDQEIIEVETTKGSIKDKTAKGFTFNVTEINDMPIKFVITYKDGKGSSRVKYPINFKARSLPSFPILFNGSATGGVIAKKDIAKPNIKVFTGYCALAAEPMIKSMNVIKAGSNSAVVKIENNDFASNSAYKKLIKGLDEGDVLQFSDIKISIGDMEKDAMPINVTIRN